MAFCEKPPIGYYLYNIIPLNSTYTKKFLSLKKPNVRSNFCDAIIEVKRRWIMAKNEKTSKRVGTLAARQLKSKKTPKKAKSVAGSALTQRPDRKRRRK
jgi:hypothetical protein